MVGTGAASRWHKLRAQMLRIRHGPGAAVIPPTVTRIHVEFAKTYNNGHMGPRRFWRDMLPRLKFHNPSIPMIVNRKDSNEGPALLSIYLSDAAAAGAEPAARIQPPSSGIDTSKAAPPAADERVVKIDMKNQRSEEILARFLAETGAQPVLPTPEEQAEMKEVEEMERQGAVDKKKQKATIDERNRERDLLKKARESVID